MSGRQSGQTLVMFAIAMTFVFLAMIALVGDVDTLVVRYNQVDAEALLRAQAGASAIDVAALYRGEHALDPTLAVQRCEQVEVAGDGAHPRQVRCTFVPPNRVTATVSEEVTLPIPLFMASATVRATRTGQAVFGNQRIVGA
ncbi:MAG TPA: hypothetical protein VKY90_21420 [Candidatus Dormibacteraeota bacterium]|nr:hypothetical protein [Candidatus Dormibacteraeota bacterium]